MQRKMAEHYSSSQHLLLVGEGDFSFSLSLATTFCFANNIVATSHDSPVVVQAKYAKAKENLDVLQKLGAKILHDIDATTMDLHNDLKMLKFDRIIFNFPHAGFLGRENHIVMINLHRQLVYGFFKNAANMLRPYGEVHVTHKIGCPYDDWNLEELASKCSLRLIECSKFRLSDYPGYNNKRGAGVQPDLPFTLGSCRTFKFESYDLRQKLNSLNPKIVPKSVQPSTRLKFNGEEVIDMDQFFAFHRDHKTQAHIEHNYMCREEIYARPMLFNNPSFVKFRDDGFCKNYVVTESSFSQLQYWNFMEFEHIILRVSRSSSSLGMSELTALIDSGRWIECFFDI